MYLKRGKSYKKDSIKVVQNKKIEMRTITEYNSDIHELKHASHDRPEPKNTISIKIEEG